jgi:hypothetical protein
MNIQGITAGQGWEHGLRNRIREAGIPQAQQHESQKSGTESTGGENKGVVRLLMEGHFQGVADVRLRINFMEELRQVADAEAATALKNEIGSLVAKVPETTSATLAGLLDNGRLSAEDIDALTEHFARTAGEIMDGMETSGTAGALQQLRDALGTLESSLAEALGDAEGLQVADAMDSTATVTPEAADDVAAAGPDESDAAVLSSLAENPLERLHEEFMSLLQDVEANVADSGSLPPLSDPRGNGRAYSKFLATYTEMMQGADAAEAPTENPALLI